MDRIVVSTDFSPSARAALDYAVGLAERVEADLHLFHAVAWPDPDAYGLTSSQAQREMWSGTLSARAAELLDEEAMRSGHPSITTAVHEGPSIAPLVLDYARSVGATLVVTGTHGRRGVGRLVLGSIADRIVRTAPMDVLLVPSVEGRCFTGRKLGRVLVPVDFSDNSAHQIAFARALVKRLDAVGLDMVHVIEPLPYPVRWLDEAMLDLFPVFRDRAAADLRNLAGEPTEESQDEGLYIERGSPARTIAAVAESLDSELILLCDSTGSPLREAFEEQAPPIVRPLLGTTAEGVARIAPCPILIARRSVSEARAQAAPNRLAHATG